MKYRWLLFDLDDTLFDFAEAERFALRKTFEDAGHPFDPRTYGLYGEINSKLWLDLEAGTITADALKSERFARLFRELGLDADAVAFGQGYLQNLGLCPTLIDGAEELVRSLHGRAKLMLVTNGLAAVQRPRLARSPIEDLFEDIVISEEVGVAKPDPRVFEAAFERMGQPPKQDVLMIGDSQSSDIAGGNGFGIDTCWFDPHREPRKPGIEPTYRIESWSEFPAVVGLAAVVG